MPDARDERKRKILRRRVITPTNYRKRRACTFLNSDEGKHYNCVLNAYTTFWNRSAACSTVCAPQFEYGLSHRVPAPTERFQLVSHYGLLVYLTVRH
jgi:hypothetical protein